MVRESMICPKVSAGLQSTMEEAFGKEDSLIVFRGMTTKALNLESHI